MTEKKIDSQPQALTPEQQRRAEIVKRVEASSALEGYPPLSEVGGYAYELQQRWVLGEITSEENGRLLAKYYGIEYVEND